MLRVLFCLMLIASTVFAGGRAGSCPLKKIAGVASIFARKNPATVTTIMNRWYRRHQDSLGNWTTISDRQVDQVKLDLLNGLDIDSRAADVKLGIQRDGSIRIDLIKTGDSYLYSPE